MPLTTKVLSLFNLSAFLSWLSFLQSSKPVHLWSSNMRCLPQKWPLQKLQSPTMRCAGSLQSLWVQRIFFGAPPRKGRVMSIVPDGGTLRDDRVELADEGVVRCFPAWTRRSEVGGREVRMERSWRRVVMVVDEGMDNGMAELGISMTQSGGGVWGFSPPGRCYGYEKRTFSWEQLDKDLVVINDFHCRSHRSVGWGPWRAHSRRVFFSWRKCGACRQDGLEEWEREGEREGGWREGEEKEREKWIMSGGTDGVNEGDVVNVLCSFSTAVRSDS